jgi:hypothetical protein
MTQTALNQKVSRKAARMIQAQWLAVVATFFPDWKEGRKWRCMANLLDGSGFGRCPPVDENERTIEINPSWRLNEKGEKEDGLYADDVSLIHAIAHILCLGPLGEHDEAWEQMIMEAGAKAYELGRCALATRLFEEPGIAKECDVEDEKRRIAKIQMHVELTMVNADLKRVLADHERA